MLVVQRSNGSLWLFAPVPRVSPIGLLSTQLPTFRWDRRLFLGLGPLCHRHQTSRGRGVLVSN